MLFWRLSVWGGVPSLPRHQVPSDSQSKRMQKKYNRKNKRPSDIVMSGQGEENNQFIFLGLIMQRISFLPIFLLLLRWKCLWRRGFWENRSHFRWRIEEAATKTQREANRLIRTWSSFDLFNDLKNNPAIIIWGSVTGYFKIQDNLLGRFQAWSKRDFSLNYFSISK